MRVTAHFLFLSLICGTHYISTTHFPALLFSVEHHNKHTRGDLESVNLLHGRATVTF